MAEYTKVDYKKLHEDVLIYQKDKSKSEPIVVAFNGFLWKFVDLICNNNFNIYDDNERAFVRLFVKNKYTLKYTTHFKHKSTVKEDILITADMIYDLFKIYTQDEIKNELICALLNMAKIYNDKEKPSFHNYVDKCFHFHAYKATNKLIEDVIGRGTYEEYTEGMAIDNEVYIDYDDADSRTEYKYKLQNASIPTIKVDIENAKLDNYLNINWINGITCSEAFNILTPFERTILKYYYIDDLNDEEISDLIGLCRVSINKKRNEAKLKIINQIK